MNKTWLKWVAYSVMTVGALQVVMAATLMIAWAFMLSTNPRGTRLLLTAILGMAVGLFSWVAGEWLFGRSKPEAEILP